MKQAYIFPGQGAQFKGMGQEHYNNNAFAKKLFEQSNEILGFRISDVMFNGSDEDLKQTNITQPAIFIHSVIAYKTLEGVKPDMVAGHSLGEFSALVANDTLGFEDGLKLVAFRAKAMQQACEVQPSTMAAVLGLADEKVEEICNAVQKELNDVVVPANYNCPGQLVISGSIKAVEVACERLKAAGAKRALILPVGGAFHSPLMQPARKQLEEAIEATYFNTPSCPVYQNVVAKGIIDKDEIKTNLAEQLTAPVKWTQCVQSMIADGASKFMECGPGKVLQGLVLKINKEVSAESAG
jgi:[acyl-carrier-protein] S-malonyltransferase